MPGQRIPDTSVPHRLRPLKRRWGNIAIGAASWYATVPFSTSGQVPPNDTQRSVGAEDRRRVLQSVTPRCLNDFSSAGDIPILLRQVRQRVWLYARATRRAPSVTGPDGGNTSFFFSAIPATTTTTATLSNSPFSTFVSATLDLPGDEYAKLFRDVGRGAARGGGGRADAAEESVADSAAGPRDSGEPPPPRVRSASASLRHGRYRQRHRSRRAATTTTRA